MNIASWLSPSGWLKLPIGGISLSEIGGIWANVDGTHIVNLIALAVVGIGSAFIGLWRFYQISRIEIAEKKRESYRRVPDQTLIVAPVPSKEVKP